MPIKAGIFFKKNNGDSKMKAVTVSDYGLKFLVKEDEQIIFGDGLKLSNKESKKTIIIGGSIDSSESMYFEDCVFIETRLFAFSGKGQSFINCFFVHVSFNNMDLSGSTFLKCRFYGVSARNIRCSIIDKDVIGMYILSLDPKSRLGFYLSDPELYNRCFSYWSNEGAILHREEMLEYFPRILNILCDKKRWNKRLREIANAVGFKGRII